MWVLEKIRESVESIPLELSRYMGRSEEDLFVSTKAILPQNLHTNILTPDKIPEFCLPPRLCKRSPSPESHQTITLHLQSQVPPRSGNPSKTALVRTKHVKMKKSDASVALKVTKKPMPFSAEGYGLAGIYESPNTRRKESLFHSKCPGYMLDRRFPSAAPKTETNSVKKPIPGFLPLFLCKHLSESGSTESETPSSSDSSPLSSPYSAKSSHYIPSASGCLKGATSCPSLIDSRKDRGRWKRREVVGLMTPPSSPPSLEGSSLTLAPPVLFPLDVLQCQEKLRREHVLPLQGRGTVRLFAEHTTFSSNTLSSLSTVRVRVVSVEGLTDDTETRILNCSVNLCLTPGKLQRQESATIRNCRTPVFNEEFFFTELSREELLDLQLRVKVVDKHGAGGLRRVTVIGVISKPLSQLLTLHGLENN